MAKLLTGFLISKTISQLLARRAAVDILRREIDKVLFAEAAVCLRARRHRLWQRHCNAGIIASLDFRAVVVPTIGDRIEMLSAENLLGSLRAREILVTVVDRFKLAAVNGDARGHQQTQLPAKADKPRAHLADRRTIVLAEISDRLVIG